MLPDSQVQGQAGTASVPTRVSAPESPSFSTMPWPLAISAVALDWKLLIRALSREGRQNLVIAVLAAAVLLNITSSAGELGRFVRAHPVSGESVLTFVAWLACCSVFVSCLLSGHIAVGRRLSEALRAAGHTYAEIAWTTAARHVAGRQTAAIAVVLIPVSSFLFAWMGIARALPLLAALLLLSIGSSAAAAVTRHLPAPARMLVWTSILAVAMGLLSPELRARWLGALSAFPPAWIAPIARPGGAESLPFLLLTLAAAAMVALESALSLRGGGASTAGGTLRFRGPATALLSSPNALLASYGRELTISLRTPRLVGLWIFGTVMFAALGTRLAPDGPLLPLAALSLVPLFVLSPFFANLFGGDGAGSQCHWILPLDGDRVFAAKERALWTLALASLCAGWSSLFFAGTSPARAAELAFLFSIELAFALWIAAAGRIISALFPRGADPRRISGDYLSPSATTATGLACTLFLVLAGGAAMLHDRGRVSEDALAFIGGGLVLLTAGVRTFLARASVVLARHRREEILKAVLS
jgi:hypothetical protein